MCKQSKILFRSYCTPMSVSFGTEALSELKRLHIAYENDYRYLHYMPEDVLLVISGLLISLRLTPWFETMSMLLFNDVNLHRTVMSTHFKSLQFSHIV